jgi:hypothetical protein
MRGISELFVFAFPFFPMLQVIETYYRTELIFVYNVITLLGNGLRVLKTEST